MRPKSREEFEIAIICALPREADAVEALFDECYDKFSHIYHRQARDTNTYFNGRIGQHNVVLCSLPGMGKGSAAAAAAKLRVSYTAIQLALVVGVCGGVPFPAKNTEIILGDVLISDSVIEYDFGKQYPNGFRQKSDVKDTLGRPNVEIRSFLAGLTSRKARNELQVVLYQHLQTLQSQPNTPWQYPGSIHDVLFEASYRHKHHQTEPAERCICTSCNDRDDPVCDEALNSDCNSVGCAGNQIPRSRLNTNNTDPCVHIGPIASADTVMKSGEHRTILAEAKTVIGFEMEGAGVWDQIPCIIIKGVCDYADSHKNKKWQDYAAATAASGAKAFLHFWLPTSRTRSIAQSQPVDMARSLYSYYTSQKRLEVQRISGELLPMDQCYINLALIQRSGPTKEENANKHSPFSLFSRLKVETINTDQQVSLPTLFEPRKQADGTSLTPKRVLIEGRAGIGKTTLCKKIVDDYLHHEMWCQLFDLVLWVPLRRLKNFPKDKYTLSSLFYHLYFFGLDDGEELGVSLQDMLDDPTYKDKVLLILDGLDEVSQEWDSDMPMNNLLFRLLDYPRVIITSRPYGVNLSSLRSLDLKLETVGFKETQVEAYIAKTNKKKANDIRDFIQKHTVIKSLVRIPIQLDALCYSWDSSFMAGDEPKTMTALYEAITLKLWQKDVMRLGKSNGLNEYDIRSLNIVDVQERILPDEINFLQTLAFAGIYNEVIEFSPSHRHLVRNYLNDQGATFPTTSDRMLKRISFLHTSDTTAMDQDQSYHFLHLTFQEFFAAQYFVKCWVNNDQVSRMVLGKRPASPSFTTPQKFLQAEKYNLRYDMMWRFVVGLLQNVPRREQESGGFLKHFFQELEAEPRDILGPAHQRLLMHCLSEIFPHELSEIDQQKMEDTMLNWLQFEYKFNKTMWLSHEREFPDHLLRVILQGESVKMGESALTALSVREGFSAELLDTLISLMKDEDNRLRVQAAETLGRQSSLPPMVLETLLSLLKDKDMMMGLAVGQTLGYQVSLSPTVIERLVLVFKDQNQWTRVAALEALAGQSSLSSITPEGFLLLIEDNDIWVRVATATVLGNQSPLTPIALQGLFSLLKDEDGAVIRAAADALGKHPSLPSATLEDLLLLSKDEDKQVRASSAAVLGFQLPLPSVALQGLLSLLKDSDQVVKIAAAQALGHQSSLPLVALEGLLLLLKDDDKWMRRAAGNALGFQSSLPPVVLEELVLLLKNEDQGVRIAATRALHHKSSLSSIVLKDLLSLLKHEDKWVRVTVAEALGYQPSLPPAALEGLLLFLKDEDHSVRAEAAKALGRQSSLPPVVLEDLLLLLNDEDHGVRAAVVEALGRQPLPSTAVKSLVSLFKNEDRVIHQHELESILRTCPGFYATLTVLDAGRWMAVYLIWLRRSFREQMTLFRSGNRLFLRTPEGIWEMRFKNQKLDILILEIQRIQLDLGISPSNLTVRMNRKEHARWKLKTLLRKTLQRERTKHDSAKELDEDELV